MLDSFIKKLQIFETDLIEELKQHAFISEHSKGDVIIKEHQYIKLLKIVLKGKVRIFQRNEDREILIYYVKDMETCTLSLSAGYQDCKSTVNAITEEDSVILNIPVRFIKDWSFKYRSWHHYTIKTFTESYNTLMVNYSDLAFSNLKERILVYILSEANNQNYCTVSMSHQRLANEFGTTRVVVSRLLKQLENENLIRLGQKKIQVIR